MTLMVTKLRWSNPGLIQGHQNKWRRSMPLWESGMGWWRNEEMGFRQRSSSHHSILSKPHSLDTAWKSTCLKYRSSVSRVRSRIVKRRTPGKSVKFSSRLKLGAVIFKKQLFWTSKMPYQMSINAATPPRLYLLSAILRMKCSGSPAVPAQQSRIDCPSKVVMTWNSCTSPDHCRIRRRVRIGRVAGFRIICQEWGHFQPVWHLSIWSKLIRVMQNPKLKVLRFL